MLVANHNYTFLFSSICLLMGYRNGLGSRVEGGRVELSKQLQLLHNYRSLTHN